MVLVMGLLDHAFPYITSSRLHQVLHRPIHTSVSFLLNASFIMPYNPRSEVQCIGPPGAEEQKRFSCLSKEGRRLHWRWSEGHVSVLKHDSSAGRSPNPLFQTSLVYVTQLFPTSATAVKGFLGVCVSPGPHQKNPS